MNFKPGGCRKKMRDTVYSEWFLMIAHLKGMHQVLIERHVNVTGMVAANIQHIIYEMRDFKYEKKQKLKCIIYDFRKHRVLFIPKFHCESNPIQRCWGISKYYARQKCNYSFLGLKKAIIPTLESVPADLINKILKEN